VATKVTPFHLRLGPGATREECSGGRKELGPTVYPVQECCNSRDTSNVTDEPSETPPERSEPQEGWTDEEIEQSHKEFLEALQQVAREGQARWAREDREREEREARERPT
jgi:hypothetical protein